MESTDNPIKELITERINNLLGEENEDLKYGDLFFPKLNTLIGTEGCLKIYEGENPIKVFETIGLSKEDYESITSIIKQGKNISLMDDSQETLSEIDKRSDALMRGYIDKIRNFKIKNSSLEEINKFDDDVKNFFGNNPVIFTPCAEYENSLENKNNVK